MDLKDVSTQSAEIRSRYHDLERQIHGSVWSVEEDALAFLTDAGLVGRFTMDNQGRWPSEDKVLLPSKIGECVSSATANSPLSQGHSKTGPA